MTEPKDDDVGETGEPEDPDEVELPPTEEDA